MNGTRSSIAVVVSWLLCMACSVGKAGEPAQVTTSPAPFDMQKVEAEVERSYGKSHPEVKEYVLWTARTFGPSGMWLNEDASAGLSAAAREKRIQHLTVLLEQGEYGRHLGAGLAEASVLKDKRLLPGLIKVAGYHLARSYPRGCFAVLLSWSSDFSSSSPHCWSPRDATIA